MHRSFAVIAKQISERGKKAITSLHRVERYEIVRNDENS